ncbi:MAG: response regulator [Bacteroidales bacterium]
MNGLGRILYAEDSENDIELTLAAFEESKLANPIDVVRDGEEALDYLLCKNKYARREKTNPLFVLLDLKMPKVDGIEVLKTIREDPLLKQVPVIMLTSSQMESDVITSYELGVNAFVVKPIDFLEFMQTVKSIGHFWAVVNKSL